MICWAQVSIMAEALGMKVVYYDAVKQLQLVRTANTHS